MLFDFLKYIMPHWYFLRKPKGNIPYWLDVDLLPEEVQASLDRNVHYENPLSFKFDAAFQLHGLGYLDQNPAHLLQWDNPIREVADNYTFVRRYFSPHWAKYILCLRVLSFHNPFVELRGFLKSANVCDPDSKPMGQTGDSFVAFDSGLVANKPFVSIIIPTLNRYGYLNDVLNDLEQQQYSHFEVIVCDQSKPVDFGFYQNRKLNITVIEQEEPALWLARNRCIQGAKGDYIAISDDDMRHKPDWLIQHLKCIDFFNADISAGTFFPIEIPQVHENRLFQWAAHFSTNNALLKKEVFSKVGLFDRQFEKLRMGDGEFGMRCYLAGLKSISNPMAASADVKAPVGGLREMGSWDPIRPTKWFAPRPVPSVLYYVRHYHGNHQAYYLLLKSFPQMVIPYRYRLNPRLKYWGLLLGVLAFPVLLCQMVISWRISNRMLLEGPKIEQL